MLLILRKSDGRSCRGRQCHSTSIWYHLQPGLQANDTFQSGCHLLCHDCQPGDRHDDLHVSTSLRHVTFWLFQIRLNVFFSTRLKTMLCFDTNTQSKYNTDIIRKTKRKLINKNRVQYNKQDIRKIIVWKRPFALV